MTKRAKLYPFFYYFGAKYRAAPSYPKPCYRTIIEPFAGAAGYSVRYHWMNIILCDINPIIYGIWDYLIHVKEEEFLKLPTVIRHVDELKICQEAKWLIGFWINQGTTSPRKQPCSWMIKETLNGNNKHYYWGESVRNRIAWQLIKIRHWKIVNKSYEQLDNIDVTWFIDPPYQGKSGSHYTYSIDKHDYGKLGKWCKERKGQTIVCEQLGADWLPFREFRKIAAMRGGKLFSNEVIWTNDIV